MSLRVPTDERWVAVPASFPTAAAESMDSWVEQTCSTMRGAWDEAWSDEVEPLIRLGLADAAATVGSEDSLTLLFWPGPHAFHAVVRVRAELNDDPTVAVVRTPMAEHLAEGPVEIVDHAVLGHGVEVHYHRSLETDSGAATLSGVYHLFEGDSGAILIWSAPTLLEVTAALIEPLRAVIEAITVDPEAGVTWVPATLDAHASALIEGETWATI